MNRPTLILSLLLCSIPVCASAMSQPRVPLLATDCIATTQINEWHIVDDRTATVRTGPKHYVVKLQTSCPQLRHPPGLIFRANSANASVNSGRICGESGETVHSRGQAPCAVESVSRIDKAQFDQLNAHSKSSRPTDAVSTHEPQH